MKARLIHGWEDEMIMNSFVVSLHRCLLLWNATSLVHPLFCLTFAFTYKSVFWLSFIFFTWFSILGSFSALLLRRDFWNNEKAWALEISAFSLLNVFIFLRASCFLLCDLQGLYYSVLFVTIRLFLRLVEGSFAARLLEEQLNVAGVLFVCLFELEKNTLFNNYR